MNKEVYNLGANVGLLLEEAMGELSDTLPLGTDKEVVKVATVSAATKGRTPSYGDRIVAIQFPFKGNNTGCDYMVTAPAHRRHVGRMVVGPEFALRGLLSPTDFTKELKVIDLLFSPFGIHPNTGKIEARGSLVNHINGVRICPSCGSVYKLTHKTHNRAKSIHGGRFLCTQKACVQSRSEQGLGPDAPQWQRMPDVHIHPDDPLPQAMFKAFTARNPVLDERAMIPRVWGVYPADAAPSGWEPDPTDDKAVLISTRSAQHNRVIRPYPVTCEEQLRVVSHGEANMCKGFIVETTVNSGTCDAAIGFMQRKTLTPATKYDAMAYGYTVRLVGKSTKRRRTDAITV